MVLVEGQPRERLEARWQIMMFAAGRVAPAMRGRQSFRTNDRSRPTARGTSSGRARGSRASNKPYPRASLLHRVPSERNRVDARALGREWFLESWSSGRAEEAYTLASCGNSSGRYFHMTSRCTPPRLPHRFSPGSKLFSERSSTGSPAGSGRTAPATWSTPRRGACSVPRDHPTPAPDSPARR